MAHIHVAGDDHAIHRRGDGSVLQIHLGLPQVGFRLLHLRFGLFKLCAGGIDLRLDLVELRLGLVVLGSGGVGVGFGVVVVVLRKDAIAPQLFVSRQNLRGVGACHPR